MDPLNDHVVPSLGDTIMGRGVMYGEFLFCPFLLELQSKCFVQVLPSMIRVKNLDQHT